MKKSARKKIKVTYNAPVTLTFTILSVLILISDKISGSKIIPFLFTSCGGKSSPMPFDFSSVLDYLRLFLHIFGSANWPHLISNFAFILLLGPMLEEKYGSAILILMMSVTSLVSGVLNACFGSDVLIGASDIAFMMILLVAFNSFSKNEIPLSFILVVILYIGREISGLFGGTNSGEIKTTYTETGISAIANIAGGICGSMFAFLASPKTKQIKKESEKRKAEENNDNEDSNYDNRRKTFFKSGKSSNRAEDETVVGSIEL